MDILQPLQLPPYPFKITEKDGRLMLFDAIRKKNIVLTPEEWVRQHFVQFLINQKKYPRGFIRLEGGHRLYGKAYRSDIMVYNTDGQKILLVECKAPSVTIDQQTFDQAARYNIVHRVPLLAVTNGMQHYFCSIDHQVQQYNFISDLPAYGEL